MIIKEGEKFPEAINLTVKSYKIGENLLAIRSALKGSITDNYNYPELAEKEFVLDADALMSGKDLQLPKNRYILTLSSQWLLLPSSDELQKLNSKEFTTEESAVSHTGHNVSHTVLATEYKRKTSEEFFFTAVFSGVDSDSKSVNSAGNILIMKYSAGTGKVETIGMLFQKNSVSSSPVPWKSPLGISQLLGHRLHVNNQWLVSGIIKEIFQDILEFDFEIAVDSAVTAAVPFTIGDLLV
jgi:hypothetical protein